MKKLNKGFTLIELLVVIGILAVLLAITLIAINPARQFSQANDTKRRSDVLTILNAIDQYAAENKGALPAGSGVNGGVTTFDNTTCTSAAPCTLSSSAAVLTPKIDFCQILIPQYIAQLPSDPKNGTPVSGQVSTTLCASGVNPTGTYNTVYTVSVGSSSRITVTAIAEIAGVTISVTR